MLTTAIEHKSRLVYFADDTFAYAGIHHHEISHPVHTHSFVEVAIVAGGEGVHHSLNGRQRLEAGDAILLRPGVWHGYEECRELALYNCCFSAELLRRELSWTRDDPLLAHLLWTGPYVEQRRGMLTTHLAPAERAECFAHLDALAALRTRPQHLHRSDMIAQLILALGCVARTVGAAEHPEPIHPAVVEGMRLIEAEPAHPWTLTELADLLHVAPGYLIRLFKSVTGLPPMAFLSRYRVELAAEMLLHTDLPVRAIAEHVGWPDPNYFARRFRAHYGLTASEYRARFTAKLKLGAHRAPGRQ